MLLSLLRLPFIPRSFISWYFLWLRVRARILVRLGHAEGKPALANDRITAVNIQNAPPISGIETICVLCSGTTLTGGPEAIHQLVGALNQQGKNAYIVYIDDIRPEAWVADGHLIVPPFPDDKVAHTYAQYQAPNTQGIPLNPSTLVILPEIGMNWLPLFKNCTIGLWWLSVDGAFNHSHGLKSLWGGSAALKAMGHIHHFCQSAYAWHTLRTMGFQRLHMLSDYTSPQFLMPTHANMERKPAILLNGAKGAEFVPLLQSQLIDQDITLLSGFTKAALHDIMLSATIYVDLGHHPGKDRLPREAAISGMVVLVRRQGAANFMQDVPIAAPYIFDDADLYSGALAQRIRDILADPAPHQANMQAYKAAILEEKPIFDQEAGAMIV